MKFGRTIVISATALIVTMGCASQRDRNKTEVVEETHHTEITSMTPTQQAAAMMDRSIVSTIDFEPGRKGLSAEATAELNRAILEAKQRGEVAEVDVAVWSDLEYPAVEGQKLPAQQVNIAKDRGENISRYIDRMEPRADVKVHNMAQQPSSFANFLKTQDATIKNKLSAMGVAPDESGNNVKGRSSSALVFIKLK